MNVMSGATPQAAQLDPAEPEEELFATSLVASNPPRRTRRERIGARVSFGLHLVILALVILLPIYLPEQLPEQADLLVNLIYNPPPPPPPPLPKGSSIRPEPLKREPPKPVADDATRTQPQFTAPIETPTKDAKLEPEPTVRPEDQFGSETGSEMGVPEGMESGVEGGVVGGVPGGVIGGVLGGTGTGPVLDYDSPPRAIKITRPQYPQEAFIKKIEGTVTVEILIDSTGRVVRARVIQSVPLLDAAALQTVYQWVFQPAIKHGRPVPTIAHAPVAFRIY